MSGAVQALHAAMIAGLSADPAITDLVSGVHDAPPPRAPFPYLSMASAAAADWSHKTGAGRELSVAVAVHDGGGPGAPARVHAIAAAVEAAFDPFASAPAPTLNLTLASALETAGWQLASFTYRRTRFAHDPAGPWSALIEWRAAMLRA